MGWKIIFAIFFIKENDLLEKLLVNNPITVQIQYFHNQILQWPVTNNVARHYGWLEEGRVSVVLCFTLPHFFWLAASIAASAAPLGIGPSHGTLDPLPGAAHPTPSLPPSPLFACLVSYGQHLAIRNCLILSPSCITVTADCFFSQVCRGRLGLGIAVSGDSHLSQMKGQDGMISSNILQLK